MSTMVSLQDFLKDIKQNYQEDIDKAKNSTGASGAWDGPPMPITQEYRVEVAKGEYKASAKGIPQVVLTFEVVEPAEFEGRKLQEYYQSNPQNEIGQRKFAELIGALGASLDGISGNDWEVLAKRFEGAKAVVALRVWGEADDRYGIRWINTDRGQVLKTDVKPIKAKTSGNNLRPDVQIRKDEPFPASTPQSDTQGQTPPTTTARPAGGPNLPPGLR